MSSLCSGFGFKSRALLISGLIPTLPSTWPLASDNSKSTSRDSLGLAFLYRKAKMAPPWSLPLLLYESLVQSSMLLPE